MVSYDNVIQLIHDDLRIMYPAEYRELVSEATSGMTDLLTNYVETAKGRFATRWHVIYEQHDYPYVLVIFGERLRFSLSSEILSTQLLSDSISKKSAMLHEMAYREYLIN